MNYVSRLPAPDDLVAFLAVYDLGGFTAAARRLGITQPAVSHAMRRLEQELGTVLFERSTRLVTPTAAGTSVAHEARAVVARLRQLKEAARAAENDRRLIRLGVVTSVVTGLMPAFLRHDTSHAYLVNGLSQNDQRQGLYSDTIDVGICRTWRELDLHHELIYREPLHALLPSDHRLADAEAVKLSDLSDARFVMFSRDVAPVAFDAIMSACHRAGYSPSIGQVERSEQVISGLVAGGMGVSIIPRMASAVLAGGVVSKPLTDRRAVTPLSVIAPAGDPRRLARHVAQMLHEVLPPDE